MGNYFCITTYIDVRLPGRARATYKLNVYRLKEFISKLLEGDYYREKQAAIDLQPQEHD